jgi:hypothetical protein
VPARSPPSPELQSQLLPPRRHGAAHTWDSSAAAWCVERFRSKEFMWARWLGCLQERWWPLDSGDDWA